MAQTKNQHNHMYSIWKRLTANYQQKEELLKLMKGVPLKETAKVTEEVKETTK